MPEQADNKKNIELDEYHLCVCSPEEDILNQDNSNNDLGYPFNRIFHDIEEAHEVMDLFHTAFQIGVAKSVTDIPAKRPELAPLLHQRVEKRDREQKLPPRLRVVRLLELLLLETEIGPPHIRFEAFRWFQGHLDAVLQDGNGEDRGGH